MESIAVDAVKPEEATASRESSILVPPANFHQAAHAVVLDDAQPASMRCVALFGSAIIVGAELMVLMGAYRSFLEGSCLVNDDCQTRGTFCRVSTNSCDNCEFGTLAGTGTLVCGPNVTAESWLASLPARVTRTSRTMPELADYAPHCAACVNESGGYLWASTVEYNNVHLMGWSDWLGLVVVSAIVGLFVAREVRDIKLCEMLARERSAGVGWQLGVGFISCCRQNAVVASLEVSVIIAIFTTGGGVLNVCMNCIALIFLIEIDDILYEHALPEWAKLWSSEHAAVTERAADSRVNSWLRLAYVLKFMACIPGVVAIRLVFPTEVAPTYVSESLWIVAVPGIFIAAVLVEPLALHVSGCGPSASWRRFSLCLLRFVGFGVFAGALQFMR